MFLLEASKTILRVLEAQEILTSGAQEVFSCQFLFSQDWEGLEKTVVFHGGGCRRSVVLNENNQCRIPWEVLQKPSFQLECGVFGTNGDAVVIPTIFASLGQICPGARPEELTRQPTPNAFTQILHSAETARLAALSLREDAAAGKFDGKSAYQYALEGGYTGTEGDFRRKLAQEFPQTLPSPGKLTFTGGTEGEYDGSADVSVTVPLGGGEKDWLQNDSSAADFIKNRPFYTKNPVYRSIFDGSVQFESGQAQFAVNEFPEEGAQVTVTANGTLCTGIVQFTSDFNAYYIGNGAILSSRFENTGELFLIGFLENEGIKYCFAVVLLETGGGISGEIPVSIRSEYSEHVTVPKRYLPSLRNEIALVVNAEHIGDIRAQAFEIAKAHKSGKTVLLYHPATTETYGTVLHAEWMDTDDYAIVYVDNSGIMRTEPESAYLISFYR